MGTDIAEDDSGQFASSLPEPVKRWLEYNEKEVTSKEGKEFTIIKVNPQKKFLWRNVASMTGLGRLTAATTLDGVISLYRASVGEEINMQDHANILRLFSGITIRSANIERERRTQEKQEAERVEAALERKGVEIGTFEKRFIPKETTGIRAKKF